MKFIVDAGKHDRPSGPVCVAVPSGQWSHGDILALIDPESKEKIPCQVDSRGQLCWITGPLKAGQKRTFTLDAKGILADGPRITIDESHPDQAQVFSGGRHVTTYNYAGDLARPFLYPVLSPSGRALTRGYPMRSDIKGERHDHQHHRSVWVAHGDINGQNYWHETKDPTKQARQLHRRFETNVSGQVFGQIKALIDWNKAGGQRQLAEQRTYTFYVLDKDHTIIDMHVQLLLSEEDCKFGDTKEGGICAIRVAGTIKEKSGGQMVNSNGQVGMKNAWGKKAKWVDYSGQVDNKTVGITVMDAPTNFRHPTRWHARDYGLLTANPFGLSHFTHKKENGTMTWKKGETLVWRYRLLLHEGDKNAAHVAGHYANFAAPPNVTVA